MKDLTNYIQLGDKEVKTSFKDKLERAAVTILMVLILGPMIGAAFSVSPYMGFAMLGILIVAIFRRKKK